MKKILKGLLLAVALTVCMGAGVSTQAAKRTKITATSEKRYLKAPKTKVGVLYEVSSPANKGNSRFVCFTAPKKAAYVITAAYLASMKPLGKKDLGYGFLYLNRDSEAGLISRQFITEGGKNSDYSKNDKMVLCTPDYFKKWKKAGKSVTGKSSPLKKRTAVLELEKDEAVYLQMRYTNGKSGSCTYRIFIKEQK